MIIILWFDSMHLAKDQSLLQVNATITGFLCSNSRNQQDRYRHYWVVEFENGIPKYAFDSLQGKQRLTTELARSFGFSASCSMLEMSMFLSYVPNTLMKQLELFRQLVKVEIPLLCLGVAEYNGLANALCKKYKASTSKKGRVQKHTLKGFKQKRQSGKPGGVRSSNGPTSRW